MLQSFSEETDHEGEKNLILVPIYSYMKNVFTSVPT